MITVIGSINMDLVIETDKLPKLGETVLGRDFISTPGGKGANQCVSIARLGQNVNMVGCLGNDILGNELYDKLKGENINVDNVKLLDNCSTGVAMIVLNKGDNFIVVDSGANFELNPGKIDKFKEIIKNSKLIVLQLEIPVETVKKIINTAFDYGVKVLLNPAPAKKIEDNFLKKIDIITPNEFECKELTGIEVNSISSAKKACEYLLNKGIKQVYITLGSEGVVYNIDKKIYNKCAIKTNVVDTTGAGDSFTGGIAVSVVENKSVEYSVDFARCVGALTVSKKGAQKSLPFRKDVEKLLEND